MGLELLVGLAVVGVIGGAWALVRIARRRRQCTLEEAWARAMRFEEFGPL